MALLRVLVRDGKLELSCAACGAELYPDPEIAFFEFEDVIADHADEHAST